MISAPTDTICPANDFAASERRTPLRERDAGILHLVGVMTDDVFAFLERATCAMVEANVPQTVILLEDPLYARLNRQLHPCIKLIPIPGTALSRPRAWLRIMRTFRSLVTRQNFSAIHLHGFLPCLFGGYFIASRNLPARVLYSPHASKSLGPVQPFGIAARRLLCGTCALARQVTVASINTEAREVYTVMATPVEVVENEIGPEFFELSRNEARRPLVVTAGKRDDRKSADVFTQAAVLLGGAPLRVQFDWCGQVEPQLHARLRAANVAVVGVSGNEMPTRFSSAWVFVQPSERPGFPLNIARAMAAGVPCVVSDTAYHRDIIMHGSTGFIYRTGAELARYLAQLIDDKDMRARIGQAARAEAEKRFGPARFRSSLSRLYGMNHAGLPPEPLQWVHEQRAPARSASNEQPALLRRSHAGS